jgi:hypothetical protein
MTFGRFFKIFMICPNAKIKIKEQACKPLSSCAHDDILAKDDERRETKSQNEDLGFEHDKASTSKDQWKVYP